MKYMQGQHIEMMLTAKDTLSVSVMSGHSDVTIANQYKMVCVLLCSSTLFYNKYQSILKT